jgi:hypothetical protein
MMSPSSNPGRQWLNANSEVIKVRPLLDAAIYLCAAAARDAFPLRRGLCQAGS